MRFLANENIPGSAVAELIAGGHDVIWIRTEAPGAKDADILAWAGQDRRILLTFDKDFGELAGNAELPESSGVILFRLSMPPISEAGTNLAEIIASRSDWVGHFSVVEHGRVRMRKLTAQ